MSNTALGGPMKRLPISIQSKKKPEKVLYGYVLSHELSAKQISFFTTQKIPLDEDLILSFTYNGQAQSHPVVMKQINEQISSSRIMNAIPNEDNPFPIRKFYRCYTWMQSAIDKLAGKSTDAVAPTDAAAPVDAAAAVPGEVPVVAAAGDAPPVADIPIAQEAAPDNVIPIAGDVPPAGDVPAAEAAPEVKAA